MNILIWHVHGSWLTGFVQGPHRYLIPVTPDRGPDGRGRARTWDWPDNAVERTPEQLRHEPIDVVILQRPVDAELLEAWTGRRAGIDVPTIWLEHNTPPGPADGLRHPAADRDDLVIAHVTHTNRLYWDCGTTRTTVIDHGICDPGRRYTGELPRAAVVLNDADRRGRATGSDLIPLIAEHVPVDLFGMNATRSVAPIAARGLDIVGHDDLPQDVLHDELARRRVYVHTTRWTSLGLALLEAMFLGMPVVALATTEVPASVLPEAGAVTNDLDAWFDAIRHLVADDRAARIAGDHARTAAIRRHDLGRFLDDWEVLLGEVARQTHTRRTPR